jgi:hypothetical protein
MAFTRIFWIVRVGKHLHSLSSIPSGITNNHNSLDADARESPAWTPGGCRSGAGLRIGPRAISDPDPIVWIPLEQCECWRRPRFSRDCPHCLDWFACDRARILTFFGSHYDIYFTAMGLVTFGVQSIYLFSEYTLENTVHIRRDYIHVMSKAQLVLDDLRVLVQGE